MSETLIWGGNANNGANDGLANANSNNTPANANTNIGSRQCSEEKVQTKTMPLGKKWQHVTWVLVLVGQLRTFPMREQIAEHKIKNFIL